MSQWPKELTVTGMSGSVVVYNPSALDVGFILLKRNDMFVDSKDGGVDLDAQKWKDYCECLLNTSFIMLKIKDGLRPVRDSDFPGMEHIESLNEFVNKVTNILSGIEEPLQKEISKKKEVSRIQAPEITSL